MKQFLFLLFAIICGSLSAQKKIEAENFFNLGKYEQSKEIYAELLSKKPKDALLNYCYGRCLYELNDTAAIPYLRLCLKNSFDKAAFYLGNLYFNDYRFDSAQYFYKQYISTTPIEYKQDSIAREHIARCATALELIERVEDIIILDSVKTHKNLILKAYKIPTEAGKLSIDTINGTFSFTTERNDRKVFSCKKNNNFDIYYSYRMINEWSKPQSISPTINTIYNENTPYFLQDGTTFYFASDKKGGLGGYDIYFTDINPQSDDYLPARNIGFPFNSPYNDYMFALDETAGIGWWATDRYQNNDTVVVYKFIFNDKHKRLQGSIEDREFREKAKLKLYKHNELKIKEKNENLIQNRDDKKSSQSIFFIINDSIIYKNTKDFKNELSLTEFIELKKLDVSKDSISNSLNNKRIEYYNHPELRDSLSTAILHLEQLKSKIVLRIKELEMKIRYIENNQISTEKK